MQTHQLEDLTLLLIRDAAEPEMWLDRWAVSYPMVRVAEAARTQRIEQWQAALQTAWQGIHSNNVAVVALSLIHIRSRRRSYACETRWWA